MRTRKLDTTAYIYALIVFAITFYGFNFWFSTSIRYLFVVIAALMHLPLFAKNRIIPFYIMYVIMVFFNYYTGDTYFHDIKFILLNNLYLLASLAMANYLFINRERSHEIMKWTLIVVGVIIVWHTVVTAFFDSMIPGIVRTLNQEIKMGDAEVAFANYYKMGMTNYLFPHAVPILVPPLLMIIRSRKFAISEKVLSVAVLLASLLLIYFSGASGPLLVSIVIVIVSFVVQEGSLRRNMSKLLIFSAVLLPLLLNDDLMLGLLDWIDNLIGGEGHFHSKVLAFQDTIQYGDAAGDVGKREDKYMLDLEGFFSNILIGTNGEVGGHSVLLSRLATLGLVGFVPLVFIITYHVKFVVKYISSDVKIYYYMGLLAAFLMMSTKAVLTWEMLFFPMTVLPISIYYFQNHQIKEHSKKRVKNG